MVENNYQNLIRDLQSPAHQVRERARFKFIALGKAAIPALSEAISSSNPNLRWQAAKALSQINDPQIIPALITILVENPFFGVRWFASDSLIQMGSAAVEPLLKSLIEHFDSVYLRENAHHILHSLCDQKIEPEAVEIVLHALEDVEPEVQVPWAAKQALELLRNPQPDSISNNKKC
jgi:HEAT repeat protein